MLLLIDFYEKTAISSKRRAQMTKVHKTVYVLYTVYMVSRTAELLEARIDQKRIWDSGIKKNVKLSDQGINLLRDLNRVLF